MSWKQNKLRPETLFDKMDTVSRVNWPSIRGKIRRNDPDGGSPDPYFPALTGKTLNIIEFGDNTAFYTVTFVSNSYAIALDQINTIAPTHLFAADDNGYIRVTNLHGGRNNGITIASGNAAAVLGFDISPMPSATSYSGEVITSPTGWPNYSNRQGSKLISRDEGLSSMSINRPLLDILNFCNVNFAELDREIAIPVAVDVTVAGGSFIVLDATKRIDIASSGVVLANPGPDVLEKFVTLLNTDNTQVFVGDQRVRLNTVTYGASVAPNSSITNWSVADGKSIFGNGVWGLTKTTAAIDDLAGNVIYAPGALFQTRLCSANDTAIITLATNNTPFNHNGEYVIDTVIDENHISIRPKHPDDKLSSSNQTPACLNLNRQGGEIYGTITIPVGKFVNCQLPDDNLTFNLTPAPPNGTYRVILPLGRTLRQILTEDLTTSNIPQPSGGQIELGSKLSTIAADALKARIITGMNGAADSTLIHKIGNPLSGHQIRIYASYLGVGIASFCISINANYNGTQWNKDVIDTHATLITFNHFNFSIHGRQAGSNAAWSHADWIRTLYVPGRVDQADLAIFWNGISVGGGIQAHQPSLVYNVKTAGTYTLASTTTLDIGGAENFRTYFHKDGIMAVTRNARWDGTNWVRDIGNKPSYKLVTDVFTTSHYNYPGSLNTFSDAAWTSKDDFRPFTFVDEFTEVISAVTTATTNFGRFFRTGLMTNCSIKTQDYVGFNGGGIGFLETLAPMAGAFRQQLATRFALGLDTNDFIVRFKVKTPNRLHLDSLANEGFFIGIKAPNDTPPPDFNQVAGIVFGSDDLNWKIRTGPSNAFVDTTLGVNNGELTTFSIERFGGVLYTYVNNQLINTQAHTHNHLHSSFEINLKGAAAGFESLALVDYVKIWAPS